MHDTLTPLPTALRRLRATDLPWATDWAAIFSTDLARPLILEIGFGYGQMLKHLAHTRPDANIIGVEISNESLLRAEAAIQHGKLPNVRVVYSRAETALYHLFAPDTLHAIHINFPDPWFKTSHTHRRLMQRATLDVMVSRMQVGAHLYLATDIAEYAVMSAKLLAETAGLTNLLDAPWVHTLPGRTVTKYEARALKEGRTCHYFAYERNGEPALPIPVYQDAPMPHLIFTSPLTLEAMQSQFQASEHKI
ncbi:MAG: tRNA (guanosine(46)-N7)-methyltransferase TrmB, partial [Armatimonadetes bacterium]|nr:tRNA (guanosine(46)-N7)-methyltransferase TrmB [Anaerolineae bacterium]